MSGVHCHIHISFTGGCAFVYFTVLYRVGLPWWLSSKESACMKEMWVPSLSQDSPGEGNGNSPQCSCLEIPMDRGAWWASVHRVAKKTDMTERLSNDNCIEYSITVSLFEAQYVWKQTWKQQYIANWVSWIPTLTLLDLQTKWTYKCALRTELVCI